MWIVGMTGGIGCGKSEAAKAFIALGVPVVDVDKISHMLTKAGQPTLSEIAKIFGKAILNQEGELNRAALRQKIFSDADAKKQLQGIMHPAIYDEVLKQLAQNSSAPYQVIDIPLLFESDRYLKLINRSLVIDCDPAIQIQRACERSGLSVNEVEKIIATQTPRAQRNQLANDILSNNGSVDELRKKVTQLHEKYIDTCIFNQLNT
jgi:dephospho-CoA kinase